MKFFLYGIITGVMAMAFEAWAPTIENATPSDYQLSSLVGPFRP
jgi:hypothetical protein